MPTSVFFLNEERKACLPTTYSSVVYEQIAILSTVLRIKLMADPGLWFATTNSLSFSFEMIIYAIISTNLVQCIHEGYSFR